jgi:hypothetical protein
MIALSLPLSSLKKTPQRQEHMSSKFSPALLLKKRNISPLCLSTLDCSPF